MDKVTEALQEFKPADQNESIPIEQALDNIKRLYDKGWKCAVNLLEMDKAELIYFYRDSLRGDFRYPALVNSAHLQQDFFMTLFGFFMMAEKEYIRQKEEWDYQESIHKTKDDYFPRRDTGYRLTGDFSLIR